MGGRARLYALFFLGIGDNVVGNVMIFTKHVETTSISLHDHGYFGRIGRYILQRHGHRGPKPKSI
jgi:hypothetical protein